MDDFKKNNINQYTAEDLNCKCVIFNAKNKKRIKKNLSKLARRRMKQADFKEMKEE